MEVNLKVITPNAESWVSSMFKFLPDFGSLDEYLEKYSLVVGEIKKKEWEEARVRKEEEQPKTIRI